MQIVMFDRQSIFIHGMKISLQHRIPGVSIQGASQADELWQKLESYPEALVMLDGDQDGEFCYWLLQKTVVQFPEVKVLITATDCNKRWLQEVIHFNVLAIVPRDSTVETFALAVNSAAMGMMFLPGDWRTTPARTGNYKVPSHVTEIADGAFDRNLYIPAFFKHFNNLRKSCWPSAVLTSPCASVV